MFIILFLIQFIATYFCALSSFLIVRPSWGSLWFFQSTFCFHDDDVRVGDMVRLLDDSQYRLPKIMPPPGPVVLKRTNHTTHRSFSRDPTQLFISAPRIVNQFTQNDPHLVDIDDHLARSILQCCGASAVQAYNQGQPYCLDNFQVDQH